MEFFLVRIYPYSDWIRKNTDQKKLRFWTKSHSAHKKEIFGEESQFKEIEYEWTFYKF